MTTVSAFENITLALQPGAMNLTTDDQNMTHISVQSSTQQNSTRLDWILYAVPASAFLLGLYLFSLVLIKHKRSEESSSLPRSSPGSSLGTGTSTQSACETLLNGFSTESEAEDTCNAAQSYENVEAAVYFNQEGVFDYGPESDGDDYVTPEDAEVCELAGGTGEMQNDVNDLHPFQNQTDTDGDSETYENMESPVYAQPHRQTDTDAQDGDYIEPKETCEGQEEGEEPNHHQTDTDDESYENMGNSTFNNSLWYSHSDLCRPHIATAVQEEEEEEDDEDSYVKMASLT